jgi:hypothetical protein
MGEGEAGWSILVIKMNWIRNYARGPFIADNSREAAVIFTSASSPRIDRTFEASEQLAQLLMLHLTSCPPQTIQQYTKMGERVKVEKSLPNLWKVVCKCISEALNDRHQVELVETLP